MLFLKFKGLPLPRASQVCLKQRPLKPYGPVRIRPNRRKSVAAGAARRMSDKTIAIIGAGIGGVAAGVALHQAGFNVKVFERASQLREAGAGMSLWPNGTGVLRQLGVLEAVASQGQSGT